MSDATLSLVILAVTIVLFVWNRLPVGVVAIASALALYFAGLVDLAGLTSGLGDNVIVFIAALFVVSEGLEASGITAWAGRLLTRAAGTDRTRVLGAITVLSAILSALITINGAAAALVPVTVSVARHALMLPSKVLIPLAYACSAGSMLTLSGSPVNVIVNDAARTATGDGFSYFEFGLIGLPLVIVTFVVIALLGDRLLPDRQSTTLPADFSNYLGTVVDHYGLGERVYRLHVEAESTCLGESADDAVALDYPEVAPIATQGSLGAGLVDSGHKLREGDVLVVSGPGPAVEELARRHELTVEDIAGRHATSGRLIDRDAGVSEIVIPPRSEWIGATVCPGMVRPEDGLLVMSIRRRNKDVGPRSVELVEGDTMLVHGPWRAIEALADNQQVLVVGSSEQLRRQTVPLGRSAPRAAAILVAMIALLASGVVPPVVAGLLGALAMIVTKVITSEQAYRAVSWPTVVLIAALIPMSAAITDSGGAELIAAPIVDLVADRSTYLLLVVLFLLTAMLGQFISNAATTLIVIPIALAAAADIGVDPQPVLMLVCTAAAAAVLTPIATPANMIVMNPGGYRFGDYWRLGIVVMACWLVIALALVPVFWPL
ncbi:SLC13 family permease [Gordonia sp. HNM0687]|uniref:SLC13 family permease n=1 Tax=Gordonia mangrovi TaxID=2665643 RepID=A0A6L7GTU0_9ACTN|nr:SLC13 family permease [Gordonia mangrovi]MXP22902.1 SLC13 family permease [Gordonia mangrovi]UVF77204.1 SLC13 family permease [Gordonia mangrovi]